MLERFEAWWEKSVSSAVGLVTAGVAVTVWAYCAHFSPGKSIGTLAAFAGVVSLRPSMKFLEKVAWVAILTALVVFEFRAIDSADAESQERWKNIDKKIDSAHIEVHAFHQEFDSQIGHPPEPVHSPSTAAPIPKVSLDITSVLAHGEAPPPSPRILKLWVSVKNDPRGPAALVNDYALTVKIPQAGEFIGHLTSPFTDDNRFVSLESQTGNEPIKPNGEIQGNLMFAVNGIPVKLDVNSGAVLILSAMVNGRKVTKAETLAEVANH